MNQTTYPTDQTTNGYYSSNLNGSNLYFAFPDSANTYVLLDSMTEVVVEKSQEDVDDQCYKDDPNVQIDKFSCIHNGETMGIRDVIIIRR